MSDVANTLFGAAVGFALGLLGQPITHVLTKSLKRRDVREALYGDLGLRCVLLGDAIRAFPGLVLRGFDLLTSLAAQNANKAPHGVRLPARGFHDLGQCCAFGALHQRGYVGFLVAGVRFPFGVLSLGCFLLGRSFPAGLALGLFELRAPVWRFRNRLFRWSLISP